MTRAVTESPGMPKTRAGTQAPERALLFAEVASATLSSGSVSPSFASLLETPRETHAAMSAPAPGSMPIEAPIPAERSVAPLRRHSRGTAKPKTESRLLRRDPPSPGDTTEGGWASGRRSMTSRLRGLSGGVVAVMLGASQDKGKVMLMAGFSRDLVERGLNAVEWMKPAAKIVGGGGGGRPDMAQAGGRQPDKLSDALKTAQSDLEKLL